MKHCKYCHGSKKMRQHIGYVDGKTPVYRLVRCHCDTEIRRLRAQTKAKLKELGLTNPDTALPTPSKQTVLLHNQAGECIHVEPGEVKDWEAEGFKRYRGQPRRSGRKMSRNAKREAGKKTGTSRVKPVREKREYRLPPRGSVAARINAALDAAVDR